MTNEKLLELSKEIIEKEFSSIEDKGGNPYLNHLYQVGDNTNGKIENKIVGYLHDLIEDTEYTAKQLFELGFPIKMISDILGVTKMKGEKYAPFILRSSLSSISKDVKQTDLTSNSDLSRIPTVKNKDLKRRSKYIYFYDCLKYDLFTDESFNCSFYVFDESGEKILLTYSPDSQKFFTDKVFAFENKKTFSREEISIFFEEEKLLFLNKNTLEIDLFK